MQCEDVMFSTAVTVHLCHTHSFHFAWAWFDLSGPSEESRSPTWLLTGWIHFYSVTLATILGSAIQW